MTENKLAIGILAALLLMPLSVLAGHLDPDKDPYVIVTTPTAKESMVALDALFASVPNNLQGETENKICSGSPNTILKTRAISIGTSDISVRVECGVYKKSVINSFYASTLQPFTLLGARQGRKTNCFPGEINVATKEFNILRGQSVDLEFLIATPNVANKPNEDYGIHCLVFKPYGCSSTFSTAPQGATLHEHIGATGQAASAVSIVECDKSKLEQFLQMEIPGVTGTEEAVIVPTCNDNKKNQGESDVDCGGPCASCPTGKGCSFDADCSSGLICGSGGVCAKIIEGETKGCTTNDQCSSGELCRFGTCLKDDSGVTCSSCGPTQLGSCGNNKLDKGEDCGNCPQDVKAIAGENACTGSTKCGNGVVDEGENCASCSEDVIAEKGSCKQFPGGPAIGLIVAMVGVGIIAFALLSGGFKRRRR